MCSEHREISSPGVNYCSSRAKVCRFLGINHRIPTVHYKRKEEYVPGGEKTRFVSMYQFVFGAKTPKLLNFTKENVQSREIFPSIANCIAILQLFYKKNIGRNAFVPYCILHVFQMLSGRLKPLDCLLSSYEPVQKWAPSFSPSTTVRGSTKWSRWSLGLCS